jgi:hypothetical protein
MSEYKVKNLIGIPTDYSDPNNWAHLPKHADKPVDTFFIYPTLYINPAPDAPTLSPIEDQMFRLAVKANYKQGPLLFEDLTNLYEPYYRQSNLISFFGKTQQEILGLQLQEPRTDLYAALDYFFENYNNGRPFIIAGHSQGSIMVKLALKDYFMEHREYLSRMVAAYVVGFSVTEDDLIQGLKFAEGADDTGVIVSWNTEGPGNTENGVVLGNAVSINPLNWRRDDTYADASENIGDRLPIYDKDVALRAIGYKENKPGLADAQLDLERGVVVCTTLDEYYIKPIAPGMKNIFGHASLHLLDYMAYWENVRENVRTRIKAYFDRISG